MTTVAARRILLLANPRREDAVALAVRLVDELAAAGITVVVNDDNAVLRSRLGDAVATVPDARGCELVVVLGGDGTILRAAELARGTGAPVLGINLGHVGFLAEVEPDSFHDTVAQLVNGAYSVEERPTLDVCVLHRGDVVWRTWALNEATVEKASRERMIELTVEIDGRPLSTWGCDGVIVATPTGSTAYAFSAGGPVVWPDVEALVVVPLSAHALFARPLVLGPRTRFAVELLAEGEGTGVLWCDGRRSVDLPLGARVEVTRSAEPVRLARLGESPFADRLVRKFDLSISGWRGRRGPHPAPGPADDSPRGTTSGATPAGPTGTTAEED